MSASNLEESLNRKLERLVLEMSQEEIRLSLAIREFEKKYLQVVLRKCGGNRLRAARMLGIHRNTLANKLSNHRL